MSWCKCCGCFFQFQSADRPDHKTVIVLLKVFNDLFLSLNKGNMSMQALFYFFSK